AGQEAELVADERQVGERAPGAEPGERDGGGGRRQHDRGLVAAATVEALVVDEERIGVGRDVVLLGLEEDGGAGRELAEERFQLRGRAVEGGADEEPAERGGPAGRSDHHVLPGLSGAGRDRRLDLGVRPVADRGLDAAHEQRAGAAEPGARDSYGLTPSRRCGRDGGGLRRWRPRGAAAGDEREQERESCEALEIS